MIELEKTGTITVMRMVRGKGNALNLEFLSKLVDTLEELERSDTRAVIITGKDNMFSAGVDLPALVAGGSEYARQFVPMMERCFERFAMFPKPLVAAVNGHAIAGGAIIMFACDQRLLARGTARIGLTEVLVGVMFPAWAMEIARYATPPHHFPTLICTGRTWLPEESLQRGLVDELLDPQQLLERALRVAEELSKVSPEIFSASKLAVRRTLLKDAAQQSLSTAPTVIANWSSRETLQRVADFVHQRIKRE